MSKESAMSHKTALDVKEVFYLQAIEDVLVEKGLLKQGELRGRVKKKLEESTVLSEEDKKFITENDII